MPTTPRTRARAQTMEDIVRIGRRHLATDGAAALSLRAVARELGVVSSAVYRYVRSRDELLTLLVVDGYTDLGDTVDAALAEAPDEPAEQFRVLARTVLSWARAEPSRYGLLFGTPVPGYDAPAEQTTAPGTRVVIAMQRIFARAYERGLLTAPAGERSVSVPLTESFDAIRDFLGLEVPDWLMLRGVTVWPALFGTVGFDVFDQYGADTFADRDELFERQLDGLLAVVGFRPGS
ncbi:TetR/AcrR family transcriptional regulator [Nocardia bovistercoris]|uniref:TetR/AcrR family transcriptional regulator n=1 Tax=Nocardia bovistercoris TaxID=2785916 RepID=A0A931ID70_9NOCA|nr:TetR/AcrR family transcriptional regulator [Nocardia bovistercoris]MBH0779274.1 TetR/AcrR family transcriptional regulator [Nocardia bovistercoris]